MSASSIIGAESGFKALHVVIKKLQPVALTANYKVVANVPTVFTASSTTLPIRGSISIGATHKVVANVPTVFTASSTTLPIKGSISIGATHSTKEYGRSVLPLTAQHILHDMSMSFTANSSESLPIKSTLNIGVKHSTKAYSYDTHAFTLNHGLYSRSMTFTADTMTDPIDSYFTASHEVNGVVLYNNTELVSKIAVSPPITEALASSISVRENNIMDATAFIWGVRDSDLGSNVKVKRYGNEYLKTHIAVREKNIMGGEVEIFGRGDSDLNSRIFAMGVSTSSLNGRIGVRMRNVMTGTTDIWGTDDSDIVSEINVKQVTDLLMTLGVTPSNRMTAIVDIQQPSRMTDTIIAKRDAFIREAYPKLNYGGEQTLLTGYSEAKSEIFRSLIGFDISDILSMTSDFKLERIVAKFKHSLGRTPTIPLELRAVNGTWSEYGVTWNNQPDSGNVVSVGEYLTDTDKGFITFDITDFVLQAKGQGRHDLDLYLQAVNESDTSVQFFSMDAGKSLAPTIEYTYYDEVIRSTGRSGIDTIILVVHPAFKNLTSKINVFKKSDKDEISSKINVTPNGNRDESWPSRFIVNRPDLDGSATVRVNTWHDLDATVSVREGDLYDLENCTITISKPDLSMELYVKHTADLELQLGVRVEAEEPLYGWAVVNVKVRPASIYVRPYDDKAGSITVVRSDDKDLESSFMISERVRVGSIYILYRDDLESEIIVQGGKDTDIPSSITANRFQLVSTIEVSPYIDLLGKLSVRRSASDKVDGNIAVSRPSLVSTIKVNGYSLLDGSVTARRTEHKPLKSSVDVSRPDMAGTITPRLHSDLTGAITVCQSDSSSLPSKTYVLYRTDIPSEMDIVGASMIPSNIRVNSGYLFSRIEVPAYGNRDIEGQAVVRIRMVSDVDSTIDVYSFNVLDGQIVVRQFIENTINSKIIVRKTDKEDITANIDVWITKNLNGKITVRRTEPVDLNSEVYILHNDSIYGKISIPYRADINGKIKVMYPDMSELASKISAKIRAHSDIATNVNVVEGGAADLLSIMGVTPTNKMTGVVDIVQPVREHSTLEAIKDAYIREDVPTLNYGEETTFAVGNYKGKVLRSLIGFDLFKLKDSYLVDYVELRMFYGKPVTKKLKLFAVNGEWSETGVTWGNKPLQGVEISDTFTINDTDGYISFNVKEFISENYLAGNNLISFYVLAEDESKPESDYFFTKEAKKAAQLVVTYFDPAIWSFGRSNIDTSIRVPSRKNLNSRLRIRVPAWLNLDIPSTLEVTRNNEFTGIVDVSKPDMLSTINAVHRNLFEVPASLWVAEKSFNTIDSIMTVSRPEIPVSFYILNRVDLPSIIRPKVIGEQDFFSWLNVNIKERPSCIYVLPHNDIELRFTVRGNPEENLNSKITVSRPNLDGSVTIEATECADLDSIIAVKRLDGEDIIAGSVIVARNLTRDLYSEILVNVTYKDGKEDLPSTINVVTVVGESEIPSALMVSRDSLEVRLEVLSKKDLKSKLNIEPMWFDSLISTVAVSKPEIQSSAEITLPFDVPSTVKIKVENLDEMDGVLAVSRSNAELKFTVKERSDLSSTLHIRGTKEDELAGSLIVSRQQMESSLSVIKVSDLRSNIDVVYAGSRVLDAVVYVKYKDDITGKMAVVGASMILSFIQIISGNLFSVISVPAYADNDLKGTIGVKNRFISEIPSILQVQEWSQIVGTIQPKVFGHNDRLGKILVMAVGSEDIKATVNIMYGLQEYLPARIAVRETNTMEGTADIIGWGTNELVSSIRPVVSYDMPSTLGVRFDNSMTGQVDFIPVGESDIEGLLGITPTADIESSVTVVLYDGIDIPSGLTVKAKGGGNLPSDLSIIYRVDKDLSSTVGVASINKMTGKVFIIPVDDSDMPSSVEVLYRNDLNSMLVVRRSMESNKPSKITVQVRGNSEIDGSINTIQWKFVNSKIIVRRNDFSEIPMRFEIMESADLLGCRITVRRTENSDLESTVTVRRSADKDFDGKIVVRKRDNLDIPSFIETWQFRTIPSKVNIPHRNDLVSTIDVVADYGYCFIM
ncbi:DNRLRE domain-containing protein [Paenibacillus sp. NPDC058177]|uniref:DNRLRE domain-containing protein n=1 Tax=Paenibacillus sp. NPDC058177 TaxID=3346369 RepID=UPI0036DD9BC4